MSDIKLKKSFQYLKIAEKRIPSLTQTFSKAAFTFVKGAYPVYVDHAKGSHIFDVDNNEYIDYLCGLGPILLGYQYKPVDEAIKRQLKNGILFSLPHKIELDLAEMICKTVPSAEMVKYSKTGSDAVTFAIRAARAITKRDKIAYCGTMGVQHDWQTVLTTRDYGIQSGIKNRFTHLNTTKLKPLKKFLKMMEKILLQYAWNPHYLSYQRKIS